jgi:hypothetical protein
MSDTQYRPTEEVREHARKSALAGRPVFANPHIGADAEVWFAAYREVPEADHGSRPDLAASFRVLSRRGRGKRGGDFGFSLSSKKPGPRGTHTQVYRPESMADAGVTALGDRMLPGSTPKPWAAEGAGL